MLGSAMLDVAIGMLVVYLLVSLFVTAAAELVASWLKWRAQNLWTGIRNLLGAGGGAAAGSDLAKALYDHPLIKGLSKGTARPSYIPSNMFALALVDLIAGGGAQASRESLSAAIRKVPDPRLQQALAALAEDAGYNLDKLKKGIEGWFNDAMDRIAGWYKRKSQVAQLLIAVVCVVGANTDSIAIATAISRDPALRAALVAQAQEIASREGGQPEAEKPIDQLKELGLPIGWTFEASKEFRQWPGWWPGDSGLSGWARTWSETIRYHFFGWALTVLAVSLGAPFWFDILKKVMSIRSAGNEPKKESK